MDSEKLNIYQKLLKISTELELVKKSLDLGKYKAVSEGDVLHAVKPLEAKYGIYSYPVEREIVDHQVIIKEKPTERDGFTIKNETYFLRIKTTYRFVNVDNPSESIDMITYGDGIDTGDKAPGKASTYCDKFALLKAYKMITCNDPDQWLSEHEDYRLVQDTQIERLISDEVIREMEELNINPEDLAKYYKKDINKLTEEDCKAGIEQKKNFLAQKKALKEKNNGWRKRER